MIIVFRGIAIETFLDGQLLPVVQQNGVFSGAGLRNSADPFVLGGANESGSIEEPFIGSLDEVRIYRRALSAAEIFQLYNSESSPPTASPMVVTSPSPQTILTGQSLQLTVTATGSAPINYQWQKNGLALPGATLATYTIASATTADSGNYSATVSNTYGTASSSSVAVTVSNAASSNAAPTTGLGLFLKFADQTTDSSPAARAITASNFTFGTGPTTNLPRAAYFNGTTTRLDFSPNLASTNEITVSMWIKNTKTTSEQGHIFVDWDDAAGNDVALIAVQGQVRLVSTKNGANLDWTSPDAPLSPSYGWRHLVWVMTSTYSRVFIDGRLHTEVRQTGSNVGYKLRSNIGYFNYGGGKEYFQGFIANLRIYERGLTDSEVQTLYLADSATTPTPPAIIQAPTNTSLLEGQALQLTVVATGTAPLSYQWQKNGTSIAGATTATLTIGSVATSDTGSYTVSVTNSSGSVTSTAATVSVNKPQPQAPSFSQHPASTSASAGASISLLVTANGTPSPTLQWYKDGVRISGQTGSTLALFNLSAKDAGTYTCEATNSAGIVLSLPATVSVGQAPTVVKALPLSTIEAKIGEPLSVSLPQIAGSAPFTYQWSRDGVVISGGSPVLDVASLNTGSAGLYTCTVSNTFGSVRIDRVRVTLIDAPRITTQPQSVTASGSATFRVTATGTPSPTYQWYRNDVALSGQTGSQLTIAASSAAQNVGGYYCVVTNRAGTVRSATAWYTASSVAAGTPTITRTVQQLDINRSIYMADSETVFVAGLGNVTAYFSTFSSSGSGTNRNTSGTEYYNREMRPRSPSTQDFEVNYVRRTPIAYIDYGNIVVSLPTKDSDGDGINDAFDYRLDGTTTAVGSGYDYANGTPFSAEIRFVRAAGSAKGQYTAKTITPLGVTAEVSGPFFIGGVTGIRAGNGSYSRGAQNRMNISVASDAAIPGNTSTSSMTGAFTFTVPDKDTINYDAFVVTSQTNVQYSIKAGTLKRKGNTYSGTMTYVDGWLSTSFVDYASNYFAITDPNDSDGDGIPDLTDDLPTPPSLASFSGSARNLEPGARLDLAATSSIAAIFVWKRDGTVIRSSPITTSDSFSIPSVSKTDTGTYWVEVTNGGGTATSAMVPVLVSTAETAPVINAQPATAEITSGSNLILSVDASAGTAARFQWRKDGVDIPGATSSILAKVSLGTSDAGYYSVLVSNGTGSTLSNVTRVSSAATSDARAFLGNLSVNTQLKPNIPLIVGAVVSGSGKPLLMRAVGPALNAFGLQGARETEMRIYDSAQRTIATARGWDSSLGSVFSLVGAFPLTSGSTDSALLKSMGDSFTIHTTSSGAGAALVELYDATGGSGQRLINMSVRNQVGGGGDVLIVGMAVVGTGKIKLLFRAVGPTLGLFGLNGVLADPKVTIYAPNGTVVASNDNWTSELGPVFEKVGAFGLPVGSRDAALLFTADAGSVYTVHVSGVNDTTGEALVEVYEVF